MAEAKKDFDQWIEPMLQSVHQQGYKAPPIRWVYIPKPGKQEKRPLGVPCVTDRALQRSTSEVLSAIYEQDFLPCSFGGRPGRGAHHALSTLDEVIAGKKVVGGLEADSVPQTETSDGFIPTFSPTVATPQVDAWLPI